MVIGWRATARHEQYKNFDRKLSSLMTVKMSTTTTAQLVSNNKAYPLPILNRDIWLQKKEEDIVFPKIINQYIHFIET